MYAKNGHRGLSQAEVMVPSLALRTFTDSSGRFRLVGVPAGSQRVVTRAVGFRPDTFVTLFAPDEAVVRDIVLTVAPTELPTVAVRDTATPLGPSKMVEFERRRAAGIGKFITRDMLERNENHRLGEVIAATVTGVSLRRSASGSEGWIASQRTSSNSRCGLCGDANMLDMTDRAQGAKPACYLDVYVNGVLMYDSSRRMSLYNSNALLPSDVEGIEVYTGPSQVPAQYNRTSGLCGVMLIWTREPPR